MKIAVFSSKPYDIEFFGAANERYGFELSFLEPRLTYETVALAKGFPVVCPFVNDELDAEVLRELHAGGTRMLALRSAGFNHADLDEAAALGLVVTHVPAYSPYAVAEHTLALMLTLNRKTHRAFARVREGNLALEGLMGFDMHGRTAGVVGTGKIGALVVRSLLAMGCDVLAYDPYPNEECERLGARYVDLDELLTSSDIISLHCPLTPETRHIVSRESLSRMRRGVMLINTGRGALVDTNAVIAALKSGQIGYLGLDVYEEEGGLFFEDHSNRVIQDDVFSRLLTFPNVVITAHQGFFTAEAVSSIAETTLSNVKGWSTGGEMHVVPGTA